MIPAMHITAWASFAPWAELSARWLDLIRPVWYQKLQERGRRKPLLLRDIRPLLSADAAERLTDYEMRNAFTRVFTELIALVPGISWAKTPELADRFGILIGDRH